MTASEFNFYLKKKAAAFFSFLLFSLNRMYVLLDGIEHILDRDAEGARDDHQ
jgi:hypothetical protein